MENFQLSPELEKWRPWVNGKKFIWTLVPSWERVWTRQQHFTLRLASLGAEIIYIEASESWLGAYKAKHWRSLLGCETQYSPFPGITVIKPAAQIPGSMRFELMAKTVGRRTASIIHREIASRKWKLAEYIGWHRVPISWYVLKYSNPTGIVYDITDDYSHFVKHPKSKLLTSNRNTKLTKDASVVFVTSPSLLEMHQKINSNTHVVPNGVDFELFNLAAQEATPEAPFLNNIPKPRIGFIGYITHWMDFDLVEKLGKRWPGQIVMVGPIHPDFEKRARAIESVHWTGFIKDREDLPTYIKGFDVVIMPFLTNDLTNHMNPLKIWEYLASGKPFVSTNLRSMALCKGHVSVADSHDQFLNMVESALSPDIKMSQERILFARNFSWDILFSQMMEHLTSTLKGFNN